MSAKAGTKKTDAPLDRDLDGEAGGSTGKVPVVTLEGGIDEMPIGEARAAIDAGSVLRLATEIDLKIAGRL
ncbi:hypothetical protein [Brevundimonas sp.]|uniref:hypothetical protein n=1 Tax=Brevundimonas sp. TaxID=1871086 RepID=UPI002D75549B|nr:hypothetical protein [Brevundimonas sp.]HYD26971.1 hypothetical protein [Brevundimonas sp.]